MVWFNMIQRWVTNVTNNSKYCAPMNSWITSYMNPQIDLPLKLTWIRMFTEVSIKNIIRIMRKDCCFNCRHCGPQWWQMQDHQFHCERTEKGTKLSYTHRRWNKKAWIIMILILVHDSLSRMIRKCPSMTWQTESLSRMGPNIIKVEESWTLTQSKGKCLGIRGSNPKTPHVDFHFANCDSQE